MNDPKGGVAKVTGPTFEAMGQIPMFHRTYFLLLLLLLLLFLPNSTLLLLLSDKGDGYATLERAAQENKCGDTPAQWNDVRKLFYIRRIIN